MTTLASPPPPAAIRGWVAAAGRTISPYFPLETFIARNPVAGYENLDREEAIGLIARDHGILLSLPEQRFRDLYARGRSPPTICGRHCGSPCPRRDRRAWCASAASPRR